MFYDFYIQNLFLDKKIQDETYQEILGNKSLLKKITQYGGDEVRPINGQIVTISFDAYLKDSPKLVDHSEEFNFILGDGDVIPG